MANNYEQLYADAGDQYGIDPRLLIAQAQVESSGDPNAEGPPTQYGRAAGIAQLIPATAHALGVTNPNDPTQAIPAQAELMAQNLKRYKDIPTALMAYHGGTDESNWGPKTRNYQQKVLATYRKMQMADNSDDDLDSILAEANARDAQAHANVEPEHPADFNAYLNNLKFQGTPTADNNNSDDLDSILAEANARDAAEKEKQSKIVPPNTYEDIVKSAVSAPFKALGAIPQIPAMAGNSVVNSIGFLTGKVMGANPELQQKLSNLNPFFTGNTPVDALIQAGRGIVNDNPGPANPLTGAILHDPETRAGRFTTAAIEAPIIGPAVGAGPIVSELSGLSGQTAAEAYPGNPLAPLIAGSIPPAAFGAAKYLAGRTSPELAQVAQDAQNRGINIPPGLLSDNPLTNRAYSLLNRLGFANNNSPEEFTSAVSNKLLGINENKLTNPVMAEAKANIGNMYNQVAKLTEKSGGTSITDDTLNKIQDIRENAVEASPYVEKFFNKLTDALDENEKLSAGAYKKLTQTGSVLDNMQKSTKPEIRDAGQVIENLLQKDLAASAGPEAQQLLQNADKQYALWHLVNDSRDDTTGLVNPATFSREAWKRNGDYFATQQNLRNPSETYALANIADKLKLTPSSNTAEHLLLERLAGLGAGAAGAGAAGWAFGGGLGGLGTLMGGYALGKGAGSALSSNWYRNYLINHALSPSTPAPLIGYGNPAISTGLPVSATAVNQLQSQPRQ